MNHLANKTTIAMSTYQIALIVGSIRKESLNRRFAEALIRLAPPEFSFNSVRIDDLPLYNPDEDERPPGPVVRLKQEISGADGVLFVTPEYNRSITSVLKNAIDHASRPYGKSSWGGKPAGVVGISVGAVGTAVAQQQLRNILAYLDMPTLGQPEAFIQFKEGLFDEDGGIGAASRQFLQSWMDLYVEWIKLHQPS
jgi:chromate reductase, NAD(P)H dehydrogenase (quinone)